MEARVAEYGALRDIEICWAGASGILASLDSSGTAVTTAFDGSCTAHGGLRAASPVVVGDCRFAATVLRAQLSVVCLVVCLGLGGAVSAYPQQADTPVASVDEASVPVREGTGKGLEGRSSQDLRPSAEAVERQRAFNELRNELLKERAGSIDLWLGVIGLVLTFFGIVIAIVGMWAFRRFREIEEEAKRSAEAAGEHEQKARVLLLDITQHKGESEKYLELIRCMTAEGAQDEPQQAAGAAAAVRGNLDASPIDKAIGLAVFLQGNARTDEAVDLWRAIARIGESANDDALQARAWHSIAYLQMDSDPEEAIASFDRAIELDPENLKVYGNRGLAKARLGLHEEAIADYNRVIELDPDDARGYHNRGNAKAAMGHHEEAIADFDTAIELNPALAAPYHGRGTAKARLGRHEEALADLDRTIKLDPSRGQSYLTRGAAKNALGRHEEAIADFDTAIELDPSGAKGYQNRGIAKATLGPREEAIADLDRAIELDPSGPKGYYNRGIAKAAMGRHEEAIADFDRAIELDPALAAPHSARGTAKAKMGRYEEAIKDLDRTIELDPENLNAYRNRGIAKVKMGRHKEAVADLARALEPGTARGGH